MADTKRQLIMDEIVARMRTIKTANGYQTDLGLNVGYWEITWDGSGESTNLPAVDVCDTNCKTNDYEFDDSETVHELSVLLRIFAAADDRASALNELIGEVQAAIKTDPRWKVSGIGLAMGTKLRSADLIVPKESFEVAGAAIEIEVSFKTSTFDAYA